MVTIREVAQLAGVSPSTVSHVINGTRFVSADARGRVRAAMEQLDYRPNALARSLRRGETLTLGMILPDSANPFFAEVGHHIEQAAFEAGYNVVLCNTEGDLEKERLYVDLLLEKQVDGIIFVAAGDRSESVAALIQTGVPLVIVDRDLKDVPADTVLTDNLQGGYLGTRHLIGAGHERIACITGPSHLTPSADRVTGYRRALAEAGIPVDESLLVRGDFHAQSGELAALQLLTGPHPPSAILACNDMMAIGVLHAAATLGLRVPADLAVIGYDDIELASFAVPSLTTVAQPKEQMAETALRWIVERTQDSAGEARRLVLPVTLIERDSSRRKR